MRELLGTLRAWRAAGVDAGRAVVVRTFGSAPRPEGAVLLVADDGRLAGSVSGGCVEGQAHEEVVRARRSGLARVVRYGISDEQAWSVGLACGGTIDVLVQPVVADAVVEAAASDAATGRATLSVRRAGRAVVTPLPPDAPGPEAGPHRPGPGAAPEALLVVDEETGLEGSLGDPETDAALLTAARDALARGRSSTRVIGGRQLFIEAFPAPPRLVIVGAVQAAVSLVAIARELGYATVIVDPRSAFATRERFPAADRIVVEWPDDVAAGLDLRPSDAVAVLSHDARIDDAAIVAALRAGCRYVGAVGSRRTQADRRTRLLAAGLAEADLARLRGPIGLDLGGRAPEEVALAVMAEVVAARHGGTARPMVEVAAERQPGTGDRSGPR
jgi:xanthine dehydrogenase accessory factor